MIRALEDLVAIQHDHDDLRRAAGGTEHFTGTCRRTVRLLSYPPLGDCHI